MSVDAVPGKLVKVTVHGATVSSLLYSVTSGGAPCDGLVFGDTVTTTFHHLRDDDDPATVTESRAAVVSTLCCASTCSFYDAAGQLDEAKLQSLTQRAPTGSALLGWLSYRPLLPASSAQPPAPPSSSAASAAAAFGPPAAGGAAALRPSMREAAVTEALLRRELSRRGAEEAAALGGLGGVGAGAGPAGSGGPIGRHQAVLLVLVGGGLDHEGATLTWQIRCFQARQAALTGELLLEPVELRTLNLGGHTGHAAYTQLHAAAAAAPLPLAPPGGGVSPLRSSQPSLLGSPSASAAEPHTALSAGGSPAAAAAAAASPPRPPVPASPGASAGDADAATAAAAALAAGARAQVGGVKAHCESLLASLSELCKVAAVGAAELVELRRRRDELLAAVAAARGR